MPLAFSSLRTRPLLVSAGDLKKKPNGTLITRDSAAALRFLSSFLRCLPSLNFLGMVLSKIVGYQLVRWKYACNSYFFWIRCRILEYIGSGVMHMQSQH